MATAGTSGEQACASSFCAGAAAVELAVVLAQAVARASETARTRFIFNPPYVCWREPAVRTGRHGILLTWLLAERFRLLPTGRLPFERVIPKSLRPWLRNTVPSPSLQNQILPRKRLLSCRGASALSTS